MNNAHKVKFDAFFNVTAVADAPFPVASDAAVTMWRWVLHSETLQRLCKY